ncbi:DoxX-like family protein [Actinokineospora alba]|uniref:DoxX-like family protein n=1 Tax=Actinokineospora alba TaxID=504798 RepID=A0A1H0FTT8_9PSEU|nr:DoxX family protein [Actinokineospora alba]TDP69610.1 DoxX-like protein [Actinokineospora alba]SDI12997.1 DoxX-like family protein [Actinokineospora alba]SDN97971.1 DoxX-like family protein [Actinokineospora alba]
MNVFLWVLQSTLAVVFGLAGALKAFQSKDTLRGTMPWVADFSRTQVRLIGVVELGAALGLILPAALGIAPVLTPLAATGLVLTMIGAVITHARRGEPSAIAVNAVLFALTAVVAWGRFGPYAF